MANTIRHKRGTSDPSASDFSNTAELLINTAAGTLFTKKDNGSVREIGSNTILVDGGNFVNGTSIVSSSNVFDGGDFT
tara:strand:- start:2681 stop:2914 length:234 start_codon:yes stop_codon:yes gene_type:complete